MYIALYDEDLQHIDNVVGATYDLTTRVYELDSFSAGGVCESNVNEARLAVVNDEAGNYKYACFVDSVKPEKKKRGVKGLDFKTLWDTEILLDFTEEGAFDGRLSNIFDAVRTAVFGNDDSVITKIPVGVQIPEDMTDTTTVYGTLQGTYRIVNAYDFLKPYLKYYEYNIESRYDVESERIIFAFVKHSNTLKINLTDFMYELTTTASSTNKTVATLSYDPTSGDSPTRLYYYRTRDNEIVQGDASGNHLESGEAIEGRLYPVRTKWFEAETLSEAQLDAVYELADARYVDNIVIEHHQSVSPIDLTKYPLHTKVELYYEGKLYKTLPISEKITKLDASGENTKIKLGFKKILLTEIIKK